MWAKNTGQIIHIIQTDRKSSHWIISRNNHEELRQGQYYVFQVGCKTLCGYGPNTTVTGFYPGEFLLICSLVPRSSLLSREKTASIWQHLGSLPVTSQLTVESI